MRPAALALAAALTLASQPQAQQQPPQQSQQPQPAQPPQEPQPPPFRAEANLVRVDVTVVDRKGEPVSTLTADDFAVDEDGAPQAIESFKFVSADGQRSADDQDSLAIRSPEHAAAEAARDDVRVFVLFWDDYHIERFASSLQGKRALSDFVSTAFGPTDLVALMEPLTPMDALRFTRDRTDLLQMVKKLEGRFGIYVPPRGALEQAQLGGDVERLRSEVTVSALESAAVHLGSIKEGRKTIIFVSQGLPGILREPDLLTRMTAAANNNNVAICTVDPVGLIGQHADVLHIIADSTGGQAIVNTNNPVPMLKQVVREASAFYLLGYASPKNAADGKFHKINVRVKRSGLEVRARKGYWAPSLAEIEKVKTEAAAAAAVPADLNKAKAVLEPVREDRLYDVWLGTRRNPGAKPEVTVAWTLRGKQGPSSSRAASVVVTAKGAGGDRSFDAPIDAGYLAFDAVPGALRLEVTVRDQDGSILDQDRQSIDVPDVAQADLAISSPVLLRARTLAEVRSLASAATPVPFAGRDFVRTDRLFVRFSVYGASAAQAAVSAHLLTKAGAQLAELPVSPRSDGEFQIDLPLSATARGEFILAVEAVHGDAHPRMLVPFRVVP